MKSQTTLMEQYFCSSVDFPVKYDILGTSGMAIVHMYFGRMVPKGLITPSTTVKPFARVWH